MVCINETKTFVRRTKIPNNFSLPVPAYKTDIFTRCSPHHVLGRVLVGNVSTEKLYALDSQVSGLSRRVIQTGVTSARFIVFVNLGRLTSRHGSGYRPRRCYPPSRSTAAAAITLSCRACSFVFHFIPVRGDQRTTAMNIYAAERTIKRRLFRDRDFSAPQRSCTERIREHIEPRHLDYADVKSGMADGWLLEQCFSYNKWIFPFCVFGFTLFDIAESLERLFVLFEWVLYKMTVFSYVHLIGDKSKGRSFKENKKRKRNNQSYFSRLKIYAAD